MRQTGQPCDEYLLTSLKENLNQTLLQYKQAAALRAKKMDQDLEQIGVYLKIIEAQCKELKLSPFNMRKFRQLLAWKPRENSNKFAYRKKQDSLEDHFLELQKFLVGIISKKFKY